MTLKLTTSPAGRKFIKAFEGFRRKSAPLPGGGWVIGYGHTKSAREGVSISEDDASKLLIYDLMPVEAALNEHVGVPLTQNQFDALASLALNIGTERFLNSEVLTRLNQNRPLDAALAFDRWRSTILDGRTVVVEALVRRRAAERALFLTPPGGGAAAPTPEVHATADDAPAILAGPIVAYRPDLAGEVARGEFVILQGETEAVEPAEPDPAPEPEAPSEAPEAEFEPADEAETEIAFDSDPADEAGAEDQAEPAKLAPAETALENDEAEEEVVFEAEAADADFTEDQPAADQDETGEPAAEEAPQPFTLSEPEDDSEPVAQPGALEEEELSWAERMRRRAREAHAAQQAPAAPAAAHPEAHPEDLRLRNSEDEWALEDESEYSPDKDRSAGAWYALFLAIGAGMAGFGAWDTWQKLNGDLEPAFLYGPVVAGAGVLFMAIVGWFLIKRVLAFR